MAELLALVMLASLVLYALMAGADFGGGVWDLLATGPRADAQRRLIERAIAPIWEANHVWLILVVVILFSAFPLAFAVVTIALHVPLTAMLIGIVLRGSAFVFRQYGGGGLESSRRWGRVFAVASTFTPVTLGVCVGALTGGGIRVVDETVTSGYWAPWLGVFPFAVGGFALAQFAFLAAVYLTVEAQPDAELAEDFRRRALGAGVAVGVFALLSAITIPAGPFTRNLFGSWWSWPLQIATGVVAVGAFVTLYRRRFPVARVLAAAQIGLILVGWGGALAPHLVVPDVTIASAAAPVATLRLLGPLLLAGAVTLLPALVYLMRVFKASKTEAP